jgi:endonuclease-3
MIKKNLPSKSKVVKPAQSTGNATGKGTKTGVANVPSLAGQKKAPEIDEKFVKARQSQVDEMMRRLCATYPDAHCELNFASTFQLLTAVILSAQTTDTGVNKATPKLFQRFPNAKALAEADIEEVKAIIRPTGYFNAKAANIQRCAQALVERFGGEVPDTLEALTSLPGVGRKTANVVLGVAFGQPGWTVDTHVQRLVRRMGFTPETDPVKIEFALQKIFPKQDWSQYSITIIWHGRRVCFARKPNCLQCPLHDLCPSSQI